MNVQHCPSVEVVEEQKAYQNKSKWERKFANLHNTKLKYWAKSKIYATNAVKSAFFLPSLKKAIANINRSSARGATSVVWTIRETIPASPKKRYMVECCQFIRSSQCFSAELYNWSLGPSANCSAKIPGVQSALLFIYAACWKLDSSRTTVQCVVFAKTSRFIL